MSAWWDLPDFEGYGEHWSPLTEQIRALPEHHPIAEMNDPDRAPLGVTWYLPKQSWWSRLRGMFE